MWRLRIAAFLLVPMAGLAQSGTTASLPDAPDQQSSAPAGQQPGAGQAGSSSANPGQTKTPETKEEQQKRARQ